MKRFLGIFLTIALMLGMFAVNSWADTTASTDPSQIFPIDGARLAAFGDSITDYGSAWHKIVEEQTGATVINCGKGGSNTGSNANHALDRFDWQVAPQFPDFVTIMFGINDAVIRNTATGRPSISLENFEANLNTIITKVKDIGAIPILITEHHIIESIWYSRYDEALYEPYGGINTMLDSYYNVVRSIASEQNLHIIDFNKELDKYTQTDVISSDGVHLTKTGNTVLGNYVADFLKTNFPGKAPETTPRYTTTTTTTAPTTVPGQTTPSSSVSVPQGDKSFTLVYDFSSNPRGVTKTNATASKATDESASAPDSAENGVLAIVPSKSDGTTKAQTSYTFAFGGGSPPTATPPTVKMSGEGLQVWINYTSDDYTSLSFDFSLHTYGDSDITEAAYKVSGITVARMGQWVLIPYSAFTNSSGALSDVSGDITLDKKLGAINRMTITANVPTVDDINKVAAIYVDSLGYYKTIEESSSSAATSFQNPYNTDGDFINGFEKSIEDVKAEFEANPNCTVKFIDNEQETNSGAIKTGMKVEIYLSGTLHQSFTAVIYGDTNGDGNINSADLLIVKKHLLEISTLEGAQKHAAQVCKDTTVSSADLLLLKRYIIGLDKISQK